MSAWNSNGLTVRNTTATTDTLLATDDVVIYSGGSAKAVSVAGAGTSVVQPGKVYRITNIAAGAVTITPASGLIDGAATATLATAATNISCRTIVSDGTGWRTISYTVGS